MFQNIGYEMSGLDSWNCKAFGMNQKVKIQIPFGPTYFLSHSIQHFLNNIRSCAKNEFCCQCTVNISNVILQTKIPISLEPEFQKKG